MTGDYDGWWEAYDAAYGKTLTQCDGSIKLRARAYFQWQGPSPGTRWIVSYSVIIQC